MYAVVRTGGKQYRVQPGDIIQVEKLEGDVGGSLTLKEVLFLSKPEGAASKIVIGKPVVTDGAVETQILGQGRGKKILIIKKKRRKDYKRTQGHRQDYTQLLVTSVAGGGEKAELSATEAKSKAKAFVSHLKEKGLGHTPKKAKSRIEGEAKPKRNTRSSVVAEKKKAIAAAPVSKKKVAAAKKTAKKKVAKKKAAATKKAATKKKVATKATATNKKKATAGATKKKKS